MENATGSCTARSHSSFSNASPGANWFSSETGTLRPSQDRRKPPPPKKRRPACFCSWSVHRSCGDRLPRRLGTGPCGKRLAHRRPGRTRHTGPPRARSVKGNRHPRWHSWRYRFRSENTASVAPVTSWSACQTSPGPPRYPAVNPNGENTGAAHQIWRKSMSIRRRKDGMSHGRRHIFRTFLRPSILRSLTNARLPSSPMRSIMERSFRLRSCPVPPGGKRQTAATGHAQSRLQLRAPSMEK